MDDKWRIATIIAVENCEVYVLLRADFQRILQPHPDLLHYLQNVAIAHLEQTPLLEESYQTESSMALDKVNISGIKASRRE